MSSMKDLIGSDLGNYHIIEEVGRGGMATVYKATEITSGREVAIKVLSPYVALEPKFKARFDQEIKVLCDLQHPNIVPVLDYGEVGDYSFIIMPFLTSGTLSQKLLQGPLPLNAAADVIHQISQALDYAHARGVVHRDLKPSNIMITDDGQTMLADFGFALVADNSLSLTGSALIGTPAYMSPEQCRGEEATPISDQYALGVILYQMATGSLPYEAETPMGVVIMHATEPIPSPREIRPDLPGSIESVILRALEKNPKDRFPSLIAFNEAVRYAVSGRRRPHSDGSSEPAWFDHPTEVLQGLSMKFMRTYLRLRNRLKERLSMVFLILVAIIAVLWGFLGWGEDSSSAEEGTKIPSVNVEQTDRSAELLATIEVLSTANAPLPGTVLAPGQIETAIAGTLEVYIATSESEVNSRTPTPTGLPGPSSTPSPTNDTYFYLSPTPTRSGPQPTSLPGTNDPTPSRTASRTPTPSQTQPTNTPTPPPPTATFTTIPIIDPKLCKVKPEETKHPHYCTPTPGP